MAENTNEIESRKRKHDEIDLENEQAKESSQNAVDGTITFKSKRRKHDAFPLENSFEYFMEDNCKMGKCKLCPSEKIKIIKMKNSNTTGLMRHLREKHHDVFLKTYPEKDPLIDEKKEVFEQGTFNKKVVDFVVKKYLPLSFFDDSDTQGFFHYLNPKANLPMRSELKSLTIKRYFEVEAVVMQILQSNNSKISFTMDGWTSISKRSYFGVTAHYINKEWKLHSLTLFFIPSHGKHTGKEMAEMFYKALESHNLLEKIQGVTLDNAAANTKFMVELSRLLPTLDPVNQHFKCYAHMIHLGVQDLICELKIDKFNDGENEDTFDGNIDDDDEEELETENHEQSHVKQYPLVKLRKLFKILKFSEQWRNKLQSCCTVTEEKMYLPNIDVSTRWNSTYAMINTAIKMQRSLTLLCETNDQLEKYLILGNEWLLLTSIWKFLRYFKELSDVLSGENYVSFPLVVIGFNLLLDRIAKQIDKLKSERADEMTWIDDAMLKGLEACFAKLLKHYEKSNWVYCAVLLLDPRHKFVTFSKTSWGQEMAKISLDTFEKIYKSKYHKQKGIIEKDVASCSSNDSELSENSSDEDDTLNLKGFFKNNNESKKTNHSSNEWRKEIDLYLSHPCADAAENILDWWKKHENLYPTLSLMARDLLSVQATSVPAERLFSRGSLTIRKHRNRLENDSVNYLMCLNSWMSCSLKDQIEASLKA